MQIVLQKSQIHGEKFSPSFLSDVQAVFVHHPAGTHSPRLSYGVSLYGGKFMCFSSIPPSFREASVAAMLWMLVVGVYVCLWLPA